jgi:hypothetical protein
MPFLSPLYLLSAPSLSLMVHSNNNITCTAIARQRVGKQVPRRQILSKQSVVRLLNNSDNRGSVFNMVCAMPSAKQKNCKHVYSNSCFP